MMSLERLLAIIEPYDEENLSFEDVISQYELKERIEKLLKENQDIFCDEEQIFFIVNNSSWKNRNLPRKVNVRLDRIGQDKKLTISIDIY